MRNTGKASELQFEDGMRDAYGKYVFLYRLEDAKEAYGLNKRVVKINPRPADYIVTTPKRMFYAEVKSISSATNGRFKLRKGQAAAITRQIVAGGDYDVYLHSLAHGKWYKIPGEFVANIQSWSWHDLADYQIPRIS